MFDILNIECINNKYTDNSVVDREIGFYGQAVVDADGYFEGLVNVICSDIHIEQFIFGSYTNDRVILYKFEPTNGNVRTRYDGYSFGNSFLGSFNYNVNDECAITGDVSLSILTCSEKELIYGTTDDIMERIDNWKCTFLDDDRCRVYENLALEVMREKDNEKVYEKK